MKNLLSFITKYNHVFLFLILESIALYWLIAVSDYHNARFYSWVSSSTMGIEKHLANVRYYFSLKETNNALSNENAALREKLSQVRRQNEEFDLSVVDTVGTDRFLFTPATIIKNSVNSRKNFITLDKGSRQGIAPDMAVISEKGVVGIVVGVSPNFSSVMSLLNTDIHISAKIAKNNYFGSLTWNGIGSQTVVLKEIPLHVDITIGDTIVTSGYSSIFPEGIAIGTISSYTALGNDFYEIQVSPFVDFRNIHLVNIVEYQGKTELESIEQSEEDM